MRAALIAVCIAQAWTIVFVLRIGPVIATIDARAGRGVHTGDVLALPLVVVALFLLGERGAASSHRRSRSAPVVI